MSNSLARIYDDYEDYKGLCSVLNVEPLAIRDSRSFYDHEDELLCERGFGDKNEFYTHLRSYLPANEEIYSSD